MMAQSMKLWSGIALQEVDELVEQSRVGGDDDEVAALLVVRADQAQVHLLLESWLHKMLNAWKSVVVMPVMTQLVGVAVEV